MLRETIKDLKESASWADDAELTFSEINDIIKKMNTKISSSDIDRVIFSYLEKAKTELERALKKMQGKK